MLYSLCFSSVWCASILAIPASIWLIVVAATSDDSDARIVAAALAALLLAFALYTRLWPRVKHQIRAGVFPFSLCDPAPLTEAELITACRKAAKNGKLRVVSHAWSFFLEKKRASGSRVWTLRFTGKSSKGAWRSGTTIAQVKRELAKEGRTFASNPTMEFASLGSWIASCSHGHPGTQMEGIEWVEVARVLHVASGEISDDGPVELLNKFGTFETDTRYVVLDVTINTVPNVMLERFARRVESVGSAEWWLAGTHVRIMFIGTAGPLGIIWSTAESTDGKQMHPHCCGAFCFWLTVDCLPALPCARLGDLSRFDGVGTLSTSNSTINPPFYPICSVWGQLCTVYNLELIIPWSTDPSKLAEAADAIYKFHSRHTGRTELRIDRSVLYLDVSVRSVSKLESYFRMLRMQLNIERAAQHPGKYRISSIAPLKEVSVAAATRPLKSA